MNKFCLMLFCLFFSFAAKSQRLDVAGSSASGTSGILSVSVTTADPGGMWDPENVLAIWVQDSSGKLMNTMMVYTSNTWDSAEAMSEWWNIIGARWSDDLSVLNEYTMKNADGITGPTQIDGLSSPSSPTLEGAYGKRYCYWGVSENLNAVPDGTYTVKMEIANGVAPVGSPGHQLASFEFEKGPNTFRLEPKDVLPSFQFITIEWMPDFTGLSSSRLAEKYSVFPNPSNSFIFVAGEDIQHIEIFTNTGVSVCESNDQHININALPSGQYIVLIKTGKTVLSKRIIKE